MPQALFIIRTAAIANSPLPIEGVPDYNRRVTVALSNLQSGSSFFVGQICLMAQTVAPAGWLICDGSAVSKTGFPALFAVIGTSYGGGDGTETFNIPTQAQCVPPAVAPTPPQVIVGDSVVTTPPVVPGVPETPPSTNPVGGTGGNAVSGGRPPNPNEQER